MLESNHIARKKTMFRVVALMMPVICIMMLLTQTVFAKNTYFINDGGRVTIHTTYATDPENVLDEAGLELDMDDTYTTQFGLGLSEITIQRMQTVNIVCGGNTMVVSTYGETVESLLNRLNLTLTEDDVISATLRTKTYDGMVLTISRNYTVEETYTTVLPYETVYCYDPSLKEGEEVVLTEGKDGQVLCTASVCYADGVEVSRTVLSQNVITQSVDALIAIGTKIDKPLAPMPEIPTAQTPEAPAAPKKPVIGDGFIITPEGEVLTYTGKDVFKATAYHNSDPGCTIWTATGTLCRVGAIAVDPKVIPYGTRMYIVSNDGRYIYGIAVAEDCGGAIKGKRIDLYFDSVAECNTFGRRDCTVYFLG